MASSLEMYSKFGIANCVQPNGEIGQKMANGRLLFQALIVPIIVLNYGLGIYLLVENIHPSHKTRLPGDYYTRLSFIS